MDRSSGNSADERPPTRRRAQPTIYDVAAASGVSKSTVSNVIRGSDGVAAATRQRVLAAISSLGYRPNAVARNLVRKRTTTIGLVVGDLANPFYSELAKLVEGEASVRDYTTMISNTDGRPETERGRIESLLEHRPAGMVMLQFSGDRSVLDELLAQAIPVTVVSCWDDRTDCVAVDDAAGTGLAVSHLLELGHRRIAYVSSGLVEPSTNALRFAGYRGALLAAAVEPRDGDVLRWERPAYLRSDRELVRRLERLMSDSLPPTAFLASNDLVAIDLVEAVEELGLAVPGDVSVVGFDDIALAGLRRVSLTTVAQPTRELARIGMEILARRIEGTGPAGVEGVRLEPALVVRSSTAPPSG